MAILIKFSFVQERKVYNPSGFPHVVTMDLGLKFNQLRCLTQRGAKVTVMPWNKLPDEDEYDALFLSNGPGIVTLLVFAS